MPTWLDFTGPCLIIAEVAQNHDGSLGAAHAYIDAAVRAGADAVKFQTHLAEAESSPDEPWRVRFSPQDETRFEYWKRMEFTSGQWEGLATHCREKGAVFLSSAFSFEAVDLLERLDIPAWKVGAGETSNLPLIARMARTGKPVILSSGLSGWDELDQAVRLVREQGAPPVVLQCTTMYPCPPEKIGLNVLELIRKRYSCPVGLSDHSGTIYAGIAAAALGAQVLEVHVTFSRECFGPDVKASITMEELARLIAGVRFVEAALSHPVEKDRAAEQMAELRTIFGKSIRASRDLAVGVTIAEGDLAFRKPQNGIPAGRFREVLDRRVRRSVAAGAVLAEEDLE